MTQRAEWLRNFAARRIAIPRIADIRRKSGLDIMTNADIDLERSIGSEITQAFPGDIILSEEQRARDRRPHTYWVLDPIGATINFAAGLPLFAISLAYVECDTPLHGAIIVPVLNDAFTASEGEPSLKNNHPLATSRRSMNDAIVTVNLTSHYDHYTTDRTLRLIRSLSRNVRGVRIVVCASLELSWVAEGKTDGFISLKSDPFGTTAGASLVRGAGGTASDASGDALTFDSTTIVVSNGPLHEALVRLTKESIA